MLTQQVKLIILLSYNNMNVYRRLDKICITVSTFTTDINQEWHRCSEPVLPVLPVARCTRKSISIATYFTTTINRWQITHGYDHTLLLYKIIISTDYKEESFDGWFSLKLIKRREKYFSGSNLWQHFVPIFLQDLESLKINLHVEENPGGRLANQYKVELYKLGLNN